MSETKFFPELNEVGFESEMFILSDTEIFDFHRPRNSFITNFDVGNFYADVIFRNKKDGLGFRSFNGNFLFIKPGTRILFEARLFSAKDAIIVKEAIRSC